MKNLIAVLGAFITLMASSLTLGEEVVDSVMSSNQINVLSYNIRVNVPEDGQNAWPYRHRKVAHMIEKVAQADVAGLQEALKGQIDDLKKHSPHMGWWGVGRDKGNQEGEFCPIFYRTDRFAKMDGDTFWLSPSPQRPGSLGWDARYPRIVTWLKLRDKISQQVFYVFNTHFDHKGKRAREESARLLVKKIKSLAQGAPSIVTGDFNANERSTVYKLLTGKKAIEEGNFSQLQDARYRSLQGHEGPTASAMANKEWTKLKPSESRIDFIFVSPDITVLHHEILDKRYEGRYPSDHLPVLARINLSQARL